MVRVGVRVRAGAAAPVKENIGSGTGMARLMPTCPIRVRIRVGVRVGVRAIRLGEG